MEEKIKLIWDFRGPAAQKTAEHHEIHLKDFLQMKKIDLQITGCEKQTDFHYTAFMVVEKSNMISLRDALKPHRGQIYKD
ncbi:hypothetical protein [Psychroflexus salis]|uniref:Uncharacterized protein n=1 Tax=Psychroflexus salis TaxID=1526574 RepID=A0A916ZPY2_9FLAO|nr:hypothetical protein [Psychroflexus salis]GGE08423.1 hypothetical protein GCM10010831_07470 [Psychroflexus salis]